VIGEMAAGVALAAMAAEDGRLADGQLAQGPLLGDADRASAGAAKRRAIAAKDGGQRRPAGR